MVVGLIGGLSVISSLTETINEGIAKLGRAPGQAAREMLLQDIKDGKLVDLAGFKVHARGISGQEDMSDPELEAEFDRINSDGNQYLSAEELSHYIKDKAQEHDPISSLRNEVHDLAASQQQILQQLEMLNSRLDARDGS